jgi:hypothetical protein
MLDLIRPGIISIEQLGYRQTQGAKLYRPVTVHHLALYPETFVNLSASTVGLQARSFIIITDTINLEFLLDQFFPCFAVAQPST